MVNDRALLSLSQRLPQRLRIIILHDDFRGHFRDVKEAPNRPILINTTRTDFRLWALSSFVFLFRAFRQRSAEAGLRLVTMRGRWPGWLGDGGRCRRGAPFAKDPAADFLGDAAAGAGLGAVALAGAALLVGHGGVEDGAVELAAFGCFAGELAVGGGGPGGQFGAD